MACGLILLIIGIIFAIFGIGGSAKLELGGIGVTIAGGAGIILIVLGVFFIYLGI